MMGLQTTSCKRKREVSECDGVLNPPSKVLRVMCNREDSDASATSDDWGSDSTSAVLAETLLLEAADDASHGECALLDEPLSPRCSTDLSSTDSSTDDEDCVPQITELKPMAPSYYNSEIQSYSDLRSRQQYGLNSGRTSPHPQYWSCVNGYYGPSQMCSDGTVGAGGVRYVVSPPPSPPSPAPPSTSQTIRCDENGKSYLDLGSATSHVQNFGDVSDMSYCSSDSSVVENSSHSESVKCCGNVQMCCENHHSLMAPASHSSCVMNRLQAPYPNPPCYRQQRLAVLNISMYKLSRYRQFPDPSLHRSVLICNTLRLIEREMEQEGCFINSCMTSPPTLENPPMSHHMAPDPNCYQSGGMGCHQEVPAPAMGPISYPTPNPYRTPETMPYEHNLRDLTTPARATPFPSPSHNDNDSGLGDEESRGINWGSVLSLSTSQSDMDSLNNNSLSELYGGTSDHGSDDGGSNSNSLVLGDVDLSQEFDDFLPSWKLLPLSADDIIKSFPSPPTSQSSDGIQTSTTSFMLQQSASSLPSLPCVSGGLSNTRTMAQAPGPAEDFDNMMHVLVGT